MERNANYALVGLASLVILAGMVIFIVWLAGTKFSHDTDLYNIRFEGPVRGLSQGGEVHFNGIKVGEVSAIALDKKDPRMVIVTAKVTSDIPIRKDSYATLEPQGITGVNYVQISAGTASMPLLKDTVPDDVIPTLTGRRDALSDLLAGGGFIVQRAVETLDRTNRVLSDQNIASLSASFRNVQSITDELNRRKVIFADTQKLLEDSDAAVVKFKDLAASSQSLVNGDGKRAIGKLGDAATEVEGLSKDVRSLVAKLKDPTTDFATSGLPQLSAAIGSLQRATDHLDQLLTEVQTNPRGLVGKGRAREIEVKP